MFLLYYISDLKSIQILRITYHLLRCLCEFEEIK